MNDSLYTGLQHFHSFGRWIVLALLLAGIIRSLIAGKSNFTHRDQKIGVLLTIFADIMLLVGLYMYFMGEKGYKQFENMGGMSGVMENTQSRFFGVEHITGMLIAIILIHIGKAQGKKNLPHKTKHTRTWIFYLLALLLILAMIPWPFRAGFEGSGWF